MFPLRDDIPAHRVPVVNSVLIGACVVVYLLQLRAPERLVDDFAMIPARVSQPNAELTFEHQQAVQTPRGIELITIQETVPTPRFHPLTTVLSCIFLHGSLLHLLGNMWFLFVFGDNVEDRLGHVGYVFFYLGSGIAASLTHYAFQPNSPIPTIGASGAVAGVMGGYLWLYPHARVTTIVPIFFFLQVLIVPAPIFLGIWFVIQLFQGTFSMGAAEAAGVAWWAHAGGFAFGFFVAWQLGREPPATRPGVRVLDAID